MARLIDADALIAPLKLQMESYDRIGACERAEAYRNCIWEINEAPTIDGWISVKDRLPSEDRRYLVCNMSYCNASAFVAGFSTCLENVDEYNFEGEKRPGWFSYDDEYDEYGYYEIDGVTHWMPLPELPKEDNNDNGNH